MPSSFQGNQSNIVLERPPKPVERMPDRQLSPTAMDQKGGILHHQDNFQLDNLIIQEKIQEAYKSFHLLKANPDTMILGLPT